MSSRTLAISKKWNGMEEWRRETHGESPGVHDTLRIRVCAAHMGGFWVLNSLNNGPFFDRFSLKHGWAFQKLVKIVKSG